MVFLLLAVIFFSYRLLFHDSLDDECIIDSIHTVTQPLNSELHKSEWFAYWFIVLAQIFIDAELVLLIVFCSLRVENFFAQVWLALFYAFRGILLVHNL